MGAEWGNWGEIGGRGGGGEEVVVTDEHSQELPLVPGKSPTGDPRLGVTLVGSDKRYLDVPNILILQKISHSLHKVTKDQGADNKKQTGKQALKFPIAPFCLVFPCLLFPFSRFPPFSHANAEKLSLTLGFQGSGTH